MATQYARQPAVPCTLDELKGGSWVQNDGLVPSGVRTHRGMVARASAIGVIVERRGDTAFTMDDGTAIMGVRSFDAAPAPLRADIGDMVLVIGRPREYQNERYLVLEICKRLRNPAWAQYRKRELALLQNTMHIAPVMQRNDALVGHTMQNTALAKPSAMTDTPQAIAASTDDVAVVPHAAPTKNPFELLIMKIRELDAGGGADVEDILQALQFPDGEKYLRTLIEEGEIFETRPGKVKVLE